MQYEAVERHYAGSLGLTVDELHKRQIEELYGPRFALNQEQALWMLADATFRERMQKLRRELGVPDLGFYEDYTDSLIIDYDEDETYELWGSRWFEELAEERRAAVERRITKLILDYRLPWHFHDWLKCLLLYNDPMGPVPVTGQIAKILDDPDELRRIPLTAHEKSWLKSLVRGLLGIKRRPPEDVALMYHGFLRALDKAPKNTRRRMRTLKTALRTLDEPYGELVIEAIPNIESMSNKELQRADQKANSRFRKQRERIKKKIER